MRIEDYLAALERLPLAGFEAIVGAGGLVVVAPHPDDESLGCGGLIAQGRRLGRAVRLVVVSDGCGSHPNSRLYPPDRLRALREEETGRAVAELGLAREHVRFLRLRDAHVPSDGPQAQAAARTIAAAARACAATALLVTWRHDPHCDHTAAADIVELARPDLAGVSILAYPIWGWALPPGTEVGPAPSGFRLDIAIDRATKRRAVAAHASQITGLVADDPDGFRLAPEMIERLCGPHEVFVKVQP